MTFAEALEELRAAAADMTSVASAEKTTLKDVDRVERRVGRATSAVKKAMKEDPGYLRDHFAEFNAANDAALSAMGNMVERLGDAPPSKK